MSKLNYKHLYEMELKAYRELYDKLEKEDIIIEHNMLSSEVKVHNIALEKCKKEYRKSADKLNIYIQDKNKEIYDKDKTIKTQENHIFQLIEEYNDLETDFEELSDNYSTMQVKYDDLLKENKSLEKDFQEARDKYFTLKVEYDDLSNKCAELYQALTIKFNTYKEYFKLTEK